MTDTNTVKIHGKDYITVAGRVQLAHDALKKLSITTEIINHESHVIIKATVTTDKGVFTGISSANPEKSIEKQNPYEVAETSAIGRALGFAGYGVTDSIATADEINKSGNQSLKDKFPDAFCSNPTCPNKGMVLPPNVVEFSKKNFGKVLCYQCQQTRNV